MQRTEEQTLQAEFSAAVAWLTLHPADWCVFGLSDDRFDVAVDTVSPAALLLDLRDEGFQVQADERTQVAQVDGCCLRVRLCYAQPYRTLARSSVRRPLLGQVLPIAVSLCSSGLAA